MNFDKVKFDKIKKATFDKRITVHPAIANAYVTLYLTQGIIDAIDSKNGLQTPHINSSTLTKDLGEQALMKRLFIELLGDLTKTEKTEETHDINYFLSKYYHLAFIQNLCTRHDFVTLQATTDDTKREACSASVKTWLIDNLNHTGLRFDMNVKKDHLTILKVAMGVVLNKSTTQDMMNSPSRFRLAVELTIGLFLLSITLSATSHIVAGKGLLLLFVGAYGAYLTHKSIVAMRAPAFEPNLSSQPDACDRNTVVINKDQIDLAPKSLVASSYGSFWKPAQEPSTVDKIKLKIRALVA